MNIMPTISQFKMLAALRGNLWCVNEEKAVELALGALELSERVGSKEISDEYLSQYYTVRQGMFIDDDKIAHIEVRGAMLQDCSPIFERVGHAIRYKTIISETQAAIEQGALGILYKINSPGGTVSGNVEAAKMAADLPVPSVSFCEVMACSAAYKFASGTTQVFASESALMGNIGTILSWADCSQFWAKWGVNFKAIVSEGSDLKSTFHLEPNEGQLAFLQDSVNESGKQFRDHVATYRERAGANLDPEVWRAGWYSGGTAERMGLIDGISDLSGAHEQLKIMIATGQK